MVDHSTTLEVWHTTFHDHACEQGGTIYARLAERVALHHVTITKSYAVEGVLGLIHGVADALGPFLLRGWCVMVCCGLRCAMHAVCCQCVLRVVCCVLRAACCVLCVVCCACHTRLMCIVWRVARDVRCVMRDV